MKIPVSSTRAPRDAPSLALPLARGRGEYRVSDCEGIFRPEGNDNLAYPLAAGTSGFGSWSFQGEGFVEGDVEPQDVDSGLTEEPERASVGVIVDELQHLGETATANPSDSRRLQPRVRDRDAKAR